MFKSRVVIKRGYDDMHSIIDIKVLNTIHGPLSPAVCTLFTLFEGQKCFLRSFFCKILTLCMISIQERFIVARIR